MRAVIREISIKNPGPGYLPTDSEFRSKFDLRKNQINTNNKMLSISERQKACFYA